MKLLPAALAFLALVTLCGCSVVGTYEFRRPWSERLELRRDHTFTYRFSSDEGGSAYEVSGTWVKVGPREVVTTVTSQATVSNQAFPHQAKWRVSMGSVRAESHNNSLRRRGS
jgi:hypothetical protein